MYISIEKVAHFDFAIINSHFSIHHVIPIKITATKVLSSFRPPFTLIAHLLG